MVGSDDVNFDDLLTESPEQATEDSASADVDDAPVVRFRIDGVLREIAQPPLAIRERLSTRIKVVSRLDISEKRVPQDGRMKLALSGQRAIDFRVSTLPTMFGEKIVMRILDPSQAKLGIEALGYEPDQKEVLINAVKRPYGMNRTTALGILRAQATRAARLAAADDLLFNEVPLDDLQVRVERLHQRYISSAA